jgi:hypothetical protein
MRGFSMRSRKTEWPGPVRTTRANEGGRQTRPRQLIRTYIMSACGPKQTCR